MVEGYMQRCIYTTKGVVRATLAFLIVVEGSAFFEQRGPQLQALVGGHIHFGGPLAAEAHALESRFEAEELRLCRAGP